MKVNIESNELYPDYVLTETSNADPEGHEMSRKLFEEYNKVRQHLRELNVEIFEILNPMTNAND